jgi:Zn-dependent metalloprotease
MRVRTAIAMAILCSTVAMTAMAAPPDADPQDLAGVLKTVRGGDGISAPRESKSATGFLQFLGAPPGGHFTTDSQLKGAARAEDIAKGFVNSHARAFGILSPEVDVKTGRVSQLDGFTFVRGVQTYEGLPVFGSALNVQLDSAGGVNAVLADIMRDTKRLDNGTVALVPSIAPSEAQALAIAALKAEHAGSEFTASDPELMIYDPAVLDQPGLVRLVWDVTVSCLDTEAIKDRVLIDAHSGEVAFRYPLVHTAKDRKIYDSNNTYSDPGVLVRSEGDGNSGVGDADQAYDYFGDTYDFYFTEHGRDSIDDAGMTMSATVRHCVYSGGYYPYGCPMTNAFWTGTRMLFGEGYVADDVVGHELTHGVTQNETALIYAYEPGAINESFSDIWGEFIDQTNGAGDDSASAKWLLGEDVPGGAIRDMKNPQSMGQPAQYLGDDWYTGSGDYGGVHINSGVGNKLCYLLTDGDTFGGQVVYGMGISKVADLFYGTQVSGLLGAASGFYDWGEALVQSAYNLVARDAGLAPGPDVWAAGDGANVLNACLAVRILDAYTVEIYPGVYSYYGPVLRNLRAMAVADQGLAALSWRNPAWLSPDATTGVSIWRKTDGWPVGGGPGETLVASGVTANTFLDTAGIVLGQDYLYAVIAADATYNSPQYARVTTASETSDFYTEVFLEEPDLSFTQITFTPTADLVAAAQSGKPEDYVNHGDYIVSVQTGVASLPVAKAGAIALPMTDDGGTDMTLAAAFPFFGKYYTNPFLSANGCLVLDGTVEGFVSPDLESHFSLPRISFLLADLDPSSGGEVWGKWEYNRFVFTFDHVPEFGSLLTNTVQCELYYSGKIRFTYLGLAATQSVVGLSDGKGVPVSPTDVAAGKDWPQAAQSDLSGLSSPESLYLEPIPVQAVAEGETVSFLAEAVSDIVPVVDFTLEDAPVSILSSAAFVRESDTAYSFLWTAPESGSAGTYNFSIRATAGDLSTSQDVTIIVTNVDRIPTATNLTLTPASPVDDDPLVGDYDYAQVDGVAEGPSLLYWFRDNVHIPALNGMKTVPAAFTSAGETWYFRVTPATIDLGSFFVPYYMYGDSYQSASVTIVDNALKADANLDGQLNSVDVQVVVNGALGKEQPGMVPDVTRDGAVSAVDVQFVINEALLK